MSFFRKRRGSQCSFANGDDEITVRKSVCTDSDVKSSSEILESNHEARSSCSSVQASDFVVNDSCAIRNFPKHKSSQLQFLAWVAYTRKYTDVYISDDERRTCPLAWCRERFIDQEAMLQHVWNCPHLAKGIYHCFQCNKIERVSKSGCRKYQGAPSRKDRMASVAKKIFSKLGAKPHRSDHTSIVSSSDDSNAFPKATGDSKSSKHSYSHGTYQQDQSMSWSHPDAQELPSSYNIPEMSGNSASFELPNTYISEMEDNFYAENFDEWDLPSTSLPKARGSSPRLEIDTSVAYTSQPMKWMDTPLSATVISPMSAFSNFQNSNSFSPIEISPTDSDTSGMSFLTDSGYSSATTQSATFSSTGSFRRLPSIGEMKGKKREFGTASEAWIKDTADPIPQTVAALFANPVLTSSDTNFTNSEVDHSAAGRCTYSTPKVTTSHWYDAPSLVLAFSEILDAHIQHTKSKLQDLPPTSTTTELISMSRTSIVSIGLEVLTGILEGRTPTAMTQIFAFTHIACALAIAIDDDEAKILTQKWFQDTLQWSSGLRGGRQQKGYEEVAKAIWQPLENLEIQQPSGRLQAAQENVLSTTCKHFLDIFEKLDSPKGAFSTASQQFDFAKASFEHRAKTRVIDALIKKSQIEAFVEDISNVEKRLQQGQITSIRELELELICAGKLASQSNTLYGLFLQHVTTLCDGMYSENPGTLSRTRCHVRDISRIKQLIPDDNYDEEAGHSLLNHGREQTPSLPDIDDPYENLFQLDLDFEAAHENPARINEQNDVEIFSRDCDNLLQFSLDTSGSSQLGPYESHTHNTPSTDLRQNCELQNPPRITLQPPTPIKTPAPTHTSTPTQLSQRPPPSSILPSTSGPLSPSQVPTLSTSIPEPPHRCHCGYMPTGEAKWKASNLRRHKRIQHATESKVYFCRWRGCKSSFTRSDNLRCHVREKGHFEGMGGGMGEYEDGKERRKRRRGEEGGGEGETR